MPESLAEVAAQWLHRPESVRISASAACIAKTVAQVHFGPGWQPDSFPRCARSVRLAGPSLQPRSTCCGPTHTLTICATPTLPPYLPTQSSRWCRCVRSTRSPPSCPSTWSRSGRRPRACATRHACSSSPTGTGGGDGDGRGWLVAWLVDGWLRGLGLPHVGSTGWRATEAADQAALIGFPGLHCCHRLRALAHPPLPLLCLRLAGSRRCALCISWWARRASAPPSCTASAARRSATQRWPSSAGARCRWVGVGEASLGGNLWGIRCRRGMGHSSAEAAVWERALSSSTGPISTQPPTALSYPPFLLI